MLLLNRAPISLYMSYDYSENVLVQKSVGNPLRNELGWDVWFARVVKLKNRGGFTTVGC